MTISTQFLKSSFPNSSRRSISRSILVYLSAVLAIIGLSDLSSYFLIIRNLEQQSNQELLSLVKVASPSLDIVKTGGINELSQEVHWQELFAKQDRSLEWYDPDGKLLAREGNRFLESTFKQSIAAGKTQEDFPIFKKQGQVRSASIAVYKESLDSKTVVLEGYIRASESTEKTDLLSHRLQLGLRLGVLLALILMILMSISSTYLTQKNTMPVNQGFMKLKRATTDMSHYLRTPLSRISMATEIMLTNDKIQASDTRKLIIIEDAVKQLKSSIEDLLLLIRLDQK